MDGARIRRFFEDEFPRLLSAGVVGASAVLVIEVPPVGAWTLSLGPEPGVVSGVAPDADLFLAFSPAVFLAVLAGESPVQGEGFVATGDLDRLEPFLELLVGPARGAHGLRARRT